MKPDQIEARGISKEPMSLEAMQRIASSLLSIERRHLERINRELEERSLRTRVRQFFERFY